MEYLDLDQIKEEVLSTCSNMGGLVFSTLISNWEVNNDFLILTILKTKKIIHFYLPNYHDSKTLAKDIKTELVKKIQFYLTYNNESTN